MKASSVADDGKTRVRLGFVANPSEFWWTFVPICVFGCFAGLIAAGKSMPTVSAVAFFGPLLVILAVCGYMVVWPVLEFDDGGIVVRNYLSAHRLVADDVIEVWLPERTSANRVFGLLEPRSVRLFVRSQSSPIRVAALTWPNVRGDYRFDWSRAETAFKLHCRDARLIVSAIPHDEVTVDG